jgi:rhodanese-related sulfurtransferase
MKKIMFNLMLVLFFGIGMISCGQNQKGGISVTDVIQNNVISYISPADLNKLTDRSQLIDIRTPREYAEGHIKEAKNINFYDPGFAGYIGKLDKNKAVYIYCRSGNRTGYAVQQLKKMGFTEIYDLRGGINNWKKNNLEINK